MTGALKPPWNLGRLQLFVKVAEEGSLTRAAAATGLAQPAISRKIGNLEAECGGRLFLRTGRGVSLSELGQRLMPRARSILRELDALSAEISDRASLPAGEVRIGALPSVYLSLVMPLLALQLAKFPGIRMHVQEGAAGQIDQWLTTGAVDIGLTYRYGRKASPDTENLVRVRSFLLGPPGDALTSASTVSFRELDGLPLVLPSAPSAVRLLLNQLARRARIHLNVVMEADSGQIQKAAATHAGIYTVMPVHAAADELAAGRLQAARIVSPRIDRDIALGLTSARPASHAAREVAKLIRGMVTDELKRSVFGA
ncbi:MAG: LysR family transcriptional regulator [Janthinobacterium lividum]